MVIQNETYIKYTFQSTQEIQKIKTVQDGGIVIDARICSYFRSFCVVESKYIRTGSDLLLNLSLSVHFFEGACVKLTSWTSIFFNCLAN